MFLALSKKNALVFLTTSIIALSAFFISCQKELSGEGIDLGDSHTDLTTKITSSVSGFVTDENEVAVNGAAVQFGSSSTTTDKFGYFEVRDVQVTQNAAVVNIIKPGYFKGIKTYIATAGKSAFFRIKLLPKSTAGNIDAAAGGSVALSNGLSVSLPAGAVVNAATNAAYAGSVTVAAQWLSPTASDLYRIMPGDLRGLDSFNFMKLLTTYGMSAVELTGTSGELLQIAPGKKATVNFPLPGAIAGIGPATIPLWYFDETKGLWKQEGNALKSGNNYVGEVSHFSYWNCDMPIDKSVQFSCTIVDGIGNPMPNVSVWIEYANGGYTGAHGYTDSTGYINGQLPANADLILKIYTDYQCAGPVYTQSVTTGTTTLSLGNITVGPSSTGTIIGNVTDCNNAPVTDGYVIFQYDYYNLRAVIKKDGTFSLNTIICSSNTSVNVIATDNSSLQQSSVVNRSIQSGVNNFGTINACGTSIEEFINYSVNGVNYAITGPVDKLYGAVLPQSNIQAGVYIQGNPDSSGLSGNTANITFEESGIAVNSTQKLLSFYTQQINDSTSIGMTILVNITEYGGVGEFIAGNFTGTVTGAPPANTPYNVTCNFRVKRSQ